MEQLYCAHCDKAYTVRTEDIRLMLARDKRITREKTRYRFDGGCFFKELTELRQRTVLR